MSLALSIFVLPLRQCRAVLADTLEGLSATQWAARSQCGGWSVHVAAAHVLAGAEQTGPKFFKDMAANAFRFNTMIDRVARRFGKLTPEEIVGRLRQRRPPPTTRPLPS